MSSQASLLKRIAAALDGAGIAYMVAGSIGSSFHGHPRATNDLDIVIAANEEQLERFAESLGEDCYVSANAVKDALSHKSMFNIIDNATGWKVDLIVRGDRSFSIEEFQRRRKAKVMGLDVFVASAEDIILSKLEWAKSSGSAQQVQDALGVVEVQGDDLDLDYMKRWAKTLNIEDSLESLLKTSGDNGAIGKGELVE